MKILTIHRIGSNLSSYNKNFFVFSSLNRLYTQLEYLKNKTMRRDNPHISKRRGGRKQTHRRFSLQVSSKHSSLPRMMQHPLSHSQPLTYNVIQVCFVNTKNTQHSSHPNKCRPWANVARRLARRSKSPKRSQVGRLKSQFARWRAQLTRALAMNPQLTHPNSRQCRHVNLWYRKKLSK